MSRRVLDSEIQGEILQLREAGNSIDKILAILNPDPEHPKVSRGSVHKYAQEYDKLPPHVKEGGRPVDWGKLANGELVNHRLPPESLRYLLDMWAEWGCRDTPVIRDARWWWLIHQAAPDAPFYDVWEIALCFSFRELIHMFGGPVDNLDLWIRLAHRPWVDQEHRLRYEDAMAKRGISSHQLIPPAMRTKLGELDAEEK
jgi:hypothetical protein